MLSTHEYCLNVRIVGTRLLFGPTLELKGRHTARWQNHLLFVVDRTGHQVCFVDIESHVPFLDV
jgi:hypothetical protein